MKFIRYKLSNAGMIWELRFHGSYLEYWYDGHLQETRYRRRLCDYQQAAKHIRNDGNIILEEDEIK